MKWLCDNGNQAGAAYIFENINGNWTQKQKLIASDGNNNDYFGYSVSFDDLNNPQTAIIGSYQDDGPSNSGSAYVFKRNITNDLWYESQRLI